MNQFIERNSFVRYRTPRLSSPNLTWEYMNSHLSANSRLLAKRNIQDQTPLDRAVFLDRDGVIIEDTGYPNDPDRIKLLPDVAAAIQNLQQQFFIIVITNQSGIARGMFGEHDLFWLHERMVRDLKLQGAIIDALYYCPHLPDAKIDSYRSLCDCRKPNPGMLIRASSDWNIDIKRSYMIGDTQRDIDAGSAAGIRSILVGEYTDISEDCDLRCANLHHAAQYILSGV